MLFPGELRAAGPLRYFAWRPPEAFTKTESARGRDGELSRKRYLARCVTGREAAGFSNSTTLPAEDSRKYRGLPKPLRMQVWSIRWEIGLLNVRQRSNSAQPR